MWTPAVTIDELTECEAAWSAKLAEFGREEISRDQERNLRLDLLGLEIQMEFVRKALRREIEDGRAGYTA